MNIIIPMSGYGYRFVEQGYSDPKPLIKVNGKRIIEYVLEMFDRQNDNFLFVCNKQHYDNTDIKCILSSYVKTSKIIAIDNHKCGPVWTLSKVYHLINNEEPVLFVHCDAPYLWNYEDFKKYLTINNPDGCLVNHIGFHPHNLFPGLMAHCRIFGDKVLEVKEKGCFTNNCISEPASSGAYYFSSGALAKKYFDLAIQNKIEYNGEYYITLVYNLLIKDKLDVRSYMCDKMISLGTPIEVENYIAWTKIIDSGMCKNESDILNCYNFWRNIIEKKDTQ